MLRDWLASSSQISEAQPNNPEPKYFLREQINLEEYRRLFFQGANHEARYWLEKSTSYYENPHVADRIWRLLPNAKVIAILRDPVDRAISNYRFSKANGLETRNIEEVFLRNLNIPESPSCVSVNPFNYLIRSNYLSLLVPFSERFKDDLIVLVFEKIPYPPQPEYRSDFLNRLGLEPIVAPLKKINASQENSDLPEGLLYELHSHYQPMVSALESQFGLDLSTWKF